MTEASTYSFRPGKGAGSTVGVALLGMGTVLSLIHISEPTRPY